MTFEINAYDVDGNDIMNLVQWDKDVYIYIQESSIGSAQPMHFYNERSEMAYVVEKLDAVEYEDYDRLIQLCDSLASAEGVWNIEDRMGDVKARYGYYPQDKWDANVDLMHYFEEKMGRNIYEVCEKDTYKPE